MPPPTPALHPLESASCAGPHPDGIPARTFESILQMFEPLGALLEPLVAAGYDPRAPQAQYPVATWRAVLELLRLHHFPQLPREEAERQLGYAFLDGFARTAVGHVVCASVPALGPERMLISFPRFAAYGRPDGTIEMKSDGERCWRAILRVPLAMPHFTAGVLERGLQLAGAHGTVEVQNPREDSFELLARWD